MGAAASVDGAAPIRRLRAGETVESSAFMGPSWYWARAGDGIVASRDIAAVACAGRHERLDAAALYDFLVLGTTLALDAERTLLEGVHRVPPGMALSVSSGGRPKLHWVDALPALMGVPAKNPDVASALRAEVEGMLPMDGAVAVLCSGGLDSSMLAAVLCEVASDRVLLLRAPRHLSTPGERLLQEELSKHLRRQFVDDVVPASFLESLDDVNRVANTPRGGLFAGVFQALADVARTEGAVLLISGDGADDLFNPNSYAAADALLRCEPMSAATAMLALASIARSAGGSASRALLSVTFAPTAAVQTPRAAARLASVSRRVPPFLTERFHLALAESRRDAAVAGWHSSLLEGTSLVASAMWRDLVAAEEGVYPSAVSHGPPLPRVAPFRSMRMLQTAVDVQRRLSTPRVGQRYKHALRASAHRLPATIRLSEKLGRWDLAHQTWRTDPDGMAARLSRLAERLAGIVDESVNRLTPDDVAHDQGAAWVRLLLLDAWITAMDRRLGTTLRV